jgi:hypothetical protein
VHEKRTRTAVDLKQNIRQEVAAIFPQLAAELSGTLGEMFSKGTPPHRHYIQEVKVVIKML